MLIGFRQHTAKKAASLRWRLLFWLFAVFAGVEAPVGAQEALGGKSSATTSSPLSGALRGHGLAFVAPDGVPASEIAALTIQRFNAIEPLIGDDSPPHGDVARAIALEYPAASWPAKRQSAHDGYATTGFLSRAPPVLG